MKSFNQTNSIILGLGVSLSCALMLALSAVGCGKAQPASSGNVTVQSAPLAGASAAMQDGFAFLDRLMGIQSAYAAVSTFTSFKACNDTLIFLDGQGNPISVGGSTSPQVGRGLLTFSPSSTGAMTIGGLNLPAGTVISEVDITFATVPTVCQGANYAVQFDPGSGPINVTQNTAFKFKYAPSKTIAATDTITLQFGAIVNAMVSLGTGLSDSTIQSINVGQAK